MRFPSPAPWAAYARARAGEALGGVPITGLELLQEGPAGPVLLAASADGRAAVIKIAASGPGQGAHFARTAAVIAAADRAGVPVPRVLAAEDADGTGAWPYLALEHVAGLPWRELRPRLAAEEVCDAHVQIAAAMAALHAIRFSSFGQLDHTLSPGGRSLLDAVSERRPPHHRSGTPAGLRTGPGPQPHLFDSAAPATLCHDDLHHGNVVFRRHGERWELAAILDWDKAWAGPAESDCARVAFWDDMTGPGLWSAYPEGEPRTPEQRVRAMVYQLLWCLEYDDASPRHAADIAALRRRLGV